MQLVLRLTPAKVVLVIAGLCSSAATMRSVQKSTPVVAKKTLDRSYHSCSASSNRAFVPCQSVRTIILRSGLY
jgi:hypothetical protein